MVAGLEIHRDEAGLPVVALDDIGGHLQSHHGIQAGLGEVGEALAVVHVAVNSPCAGSEIIVVVDEVDGDTPGGRGQLHQAGELLPPAHLHPELCDLLYQNGGIGFDLVVIWQEQGHFIALNGGQCLGQGRHHIAQAAGFGIGRRFRSADGNFHTVSPRLMTIGLFRVPMSLAPGRTVTFLSRMTFFNSAPSPMVVSFMMTQSST